MRALGPAEARGGDGAGDGAEVAAEVGGQVHGYEGSGACGGLDDDGHAGEGGHDPVAGWKRPAPGGGPGRQLGDRQADFADAAPEGAVAGRVGDVGAAAEDGDGAAGVEGAAVGAAVDPEGEAADDGHPRGGQLTPQLAGDLAAVGGGAAGADDRHRFERLQPLEQLRISAADQRPGSIGGVPQRARVEVAVAAAGPAPGHRQLFVQPFLGQRGIPCQQLPRRLRGRDLDQLLAGETQQFRRAGAGLAGRDPLDVWTEVRQQPGPPQALEAGARLKHAPASASAGPAPSAPRRSRRAPPGR